MPRGPKGEKRPADVIGAAVMVGRIATGEIEERPTKDSAAAELGRTQSGNWVRPEIPESFRVVAPIISRIDLSG
jgi:hypothetical protein